MAIDATIPAIAVKAELKCMADISTLPGKLNAQIMKANRVAMTGKDTMVRSAGNLPVFCFTLPANGNQTLAAHKTRNVISTANSGRV